MNVETFGREKLNRRRMEKIVNKGSEEWPHLRLYSKKGILLGSSKWVL